MKKKERKKKKAWWDWAKGKASKSCNVSGVGMYGIVCVCVWCDGMLSSIPCNCFVPVLLLLFYFIT